MRTTEEEESLIGRKDEEDALASAMEGGHRLINIVGLGGMGKTSLARSFFRRESISHRWISCASFTETSQIVSELGALFQVPNPTEMSLAFVLANQPVVIYLDNAEHLVPEIAGFLETFLTRTSRPIFLLSSRIALASPNEWVLTLKPLTLKPSAQSPEGESDAYRLLVQRMQNTRPGWMPNESDRAILEELCALSSGIPLAIELIAANTEALTLPEIVTRLSSTSTSAGAPESTHPAILACVELSYRLLPAAERDFFVDLAMFPSEGFSLELAEVSAGGMVDQMLQTLVRHSLLWNEYQADGSICFGMYALVRQFAYKLSNEAQRERWFSRLALHLGSKYLGSWQMVDFVTNDQPIVGEVRRESVLMDAILLHYFDPKNSSLHKTRSAEFNEQKVDLLCSLVTITLTLNALRRCEGRYRTYAACFRQLIAWGNHLPANARSAVIYGITRFWSGTHASDAAAFVDPSHPLHAARKEPSPRSLHQQAFVAFWEERPWTAPFSKAVSLIRSGGSVEQGKILLLRAGQLAEEREHWVEAARLYSMAMVHGMIGRRNKASEYENLTTAIERCCASSGNLASGNPRVLYTLGYSAAVDDNYEEASALMHRSASILDGWGWTEAHTNFGIAALYRMRAESFEPSDEWRDAVERYLGQETSIIVRWGKLALAIGWVYREKLALAAEALNNALASAEKDGQDRGHIALLLAFRAWVEYSLHIPHQLSLSSAREHVVGRGETYQLAVSIFSALIGSDPLNGDPLNGDDASEDTADDDTLRAQITRLSVLSDEGMHCAQMFERVLQNLRHSRVASDGSWFEIDRVRRPVNGGLQRLFLRALANARKDGVLSLSPEMLIAELWPKEPDPSALKLRNRLRVLVYDLRNLGMEEILKTDAAGHYQLAEVAIVESEAT